MAPYRDEFCIFEAQNCGLSRDLFMGVMRVVFKSKLTEVATFTEVQDW